MPRRSDSLPTTLAQARAAFTAKREALVAANKRAEAAEARAAAAENEAKSHALLIEKLKFTIAKLRHMQFGQSAERGAILEQLELQLAGLEENALQAQAERDAAEAAAATKINVVAFQRRRPSRQPLPADLPRERLVHPSPAACPCCGGARLRKIGEDVTEMLEHSFVGIFSMSGTTEAKGAASSAVFTIASTGVHMLAGPTVCASIDKVPR